MQCGGLPALTSSPSVILHNIQSATAYMLVDDSLPFTSRSSALSSNSTAGCFPLSAQDSRVGSGSSGLPCSPPDSSLSFSVCTLASTFESFPSRIPPPATPASHSNNQSSRSSSTHSHSLWCRHSQSTPVSHLKQWFKANLQRTSTAIDKMWCTNHSKP